MAKNLSTNRPRRFDRFSSTRFATAAQNRFADTSPMNRHHQTPTAIPSGPSAPASSRVRSATGRSAIRAEIVFQLRLPLASIAARQCRPPTNQQRRRRCPTFALSQPSPTRSRTPSSAYDSSAPLNPADQTGSTTTAPTSVERRVQNRRLQHKTIQNFESLETHFAAATTCRPPSSQSKSRTASNRFAAAPPDRQCNPNCTESDESPRTLPTRTPTQE